MAIVQRLLLAGCDGKVQVFVEYNDTNLAMTKVIATNGLNRSDDRPTVIIKMGGAVGTITTQINKVGNTLNLPVNQYFMIVDAEDGKPVLPYEVGLIVPFGADT